MPIRGSVGYTNVGNVSASPFNFTVTKPGGASTPVADDVVALHVLVYSGGGIVRAVDAIPSGWTEETGARFTITSGSDNEVLRFYWYRATGSDPASWTFSLDGDSFVQYQIGVYSGRETAASPVDAVSGQNGTTASCTAPSLTASSASTDLIFVGTNLNGRTYTPPASDGWTERHEDSGTNNYWADKVAGAGATGSKTFTMNSGDPNNGTMIALKPAGGGGGTTFTSSVGGGLTPAGAAVKQAQKRPAGAVTPSGAALKSLARALAGGLTPAGTAQKRIGRALAGGVTPSSTLATLKVLLRAYGGALTPSGALARLPAKVLAGGVTPTGGLGRSLTRSLGGALAPAGDLVRALARALTGGIAPTGAATTDTFTSGASGGEAAGYGPTGVVPASGLRRAVVASSRRVARVTSQEG